MKRLSQLLLFVVAGFVCPLCVAEPYQITDSFGKHWFDVPPERVVVTDWTLFEQLLELGVVPVGAPELDAYRRLVVQPTVPESVRDIGLRKSPNLNVLRALKPDLIILGTGQKELTRVLSRIARVSYYNNFSVHYRTNGLKSRERFLQLGRLFQKEDVAQRKLDAMDKEIYQLRQQLYERFSGHLPKVTAGRFVHNRRIVLYGTNSMPHYVLKLLGFEGEFEVGKSAWGEREVFIDKLSAIREGYLLYFEPVEVSDDVFVSDVWQKLDVVKRQRVRAVAPVWSYGGAMSVLYMAKAFSKVFLQDPSFL